MRINEKLNKFKENRIAVAIGWRGVKQVKGIKRYKLPIIKQSQGIKVQHREYGQ